MVAKCNRESSPHHPATREIGQQFKPILKLAEQVRLAGARLTDNGHIVRAWPQIAKQGAQAIDRFEGDVSAWRYSNPSIFMTLR